MRKTLRRSLALALGGTLLIAGCYTVPETGRRSLNLVGDEQLQLAAVAQFEQMKAQIPISSNSEYKSQVERVGRRIAAVVGDKIESPEWEWVVFDDPQVNAFAMPGGKVGVYTGLLKLVESDDELATVMGHEIAHVIARHGNERVSQSTAAQIGAIGVGILVGGESETTQQLAMAAYGAGAQIGVLLPFSRFHESEADEIGLVYMARAGYDPRASISFWEKMAAQSGSGGQPPEILSTHPSHGTRIERLQKLIPKVMGDYEKARQAAQNN